LRRLEIVQIGLGHVGRAVAQIVLEERKRLLERRSVELRYRAVSDTSGALVGWRCTGGRSTSTCSA
jgi:homoserine dehydrogenase/aspartokinase/homoserine dehydrogenase 1